MVMGPATPHVFAHAPSDGGPGRHLPTHAPATGAAEP